MATSAKAKKKTVRIASGLKRARQDVKLNAANTALRSKFRTVIKNVQKALVAGDKAKAKTAYQDFLNLWSDADPHIRRIAASEFPNESCSRQCEIVRKRPLQSFDRV